MSKHSARGGLVWSSDPQGVRCDKCGQRPCVCSSPSGFPPTEKQVARLTRSVKGRAGKVVVLIDGLQLPPQGYRELQRHLSSALGTGGTVKGETIEIQGDMRDRVADALAGLGYRVKLAGG